MIRAPLLASAMEALLYFIIAFGPLAFGAVEPWSKAVLRGACVVLAVLAGFDARTSSNHSVQLPLLSAMLLIALVAGIQWMTPRSLGLPTTPWPFTADRAATTDALLGWLCACALVWASAKVASRPDAWARLPWAIFLVGAILAIIAIAQEGQGNMAYYGLRPRRQGAAFGPYVNKNHAANLLAMAAALGGGLGLVGWRRAMGEISISRIAERGAQLCVSLFLLGVTVYALRRTNCRGALVAGTAAGVLVLCLRGSMTPRQDRYWIFGRLAILGCVASLAGWNFQALQALISADDSARFRISILRDAWTMLCDFPIFGVGLGAVRTAYWPYQKHLLNQVAIDHLHNDWAEVLIQVGLVGGLVFLTGAVLTFVLVLRKAHISEPPDRACLRTAGIIAVAFFVFHSFVDFSFQIPANASIFLILLSWLVQESKPPRSEPL